MRRRLTLIAICFVASALVLPRTGQAEHPLLDQASVSALLQVPAVADPWRLDTRVGRYLLRLEFPKDSPSVLGLPDVARDAVVQFERRRAENLVRLTEVATKLQTVLASGGLSLVPEYDLPLKRVVLGLHTSDGDSGAPLARIAPVIAALPRSIQMELLVPDGILASSRRDLQARFPGRVVHLVPLQVYQQRPGVIEVVNEPTRWMRDLFKVVDGPNAKSVFLVPLAYKQVDDLVPPDNHYVTQFLSAHGRVVHVPMFFRSGNLMLGRNAKGQKVLFVGDRELILNQTYFYNSFFYFPPTEAFLELLKRITGAEMVKVLKNTDHLFHLDMAMIMLGDGSAGVLRMIDRGGGDKSDTAALSEIRAALRTLDFRVLDIETTAERVSAFQSPVNALTYIDSSNGARWALVPQFPDMQVMVSGTSESLNDRILRVYEKAGFRVVPVEDRLHPFGGNTHCATNVIR